MIFLVEIFLLFACLLWFPCGILFKSRTAWGMWLTAVGLVVLIECGKAGVLG